MVAHHAYLTLPRPSLHCSLSSEGFSIQSARGGSRFGAQRPLSLHTRGTLRFRAAADGSESRRSDSSVQSPPPRLRNPSMDSSELQTVFVEDEDVSVEGVAMVDRKVSSEDSSWSRVAFLAGGDIVALFTFAAIGRLSHGMAVLDFDAFRTADPFIAGWLLGAYLLGGYGPDGQGVNGFSGAVTAAVKSWAVGIPMALVIRGLISGHVPPQSFIIVSMASTLFLLVGWRAAVAFVFPYEKKSSKKLNGNRKGSIFELFQLLSSLVRRW